MSTSETAIDAMARVLEDLKREERELTEETATLQGRLSAVRDAIMSLEKLTPASRKTIQLRIFPRTRNRLQELLEEGERGNALPLVRQAAVPPNPFEGMQFGEALQFYLRTEPEPLSAADIATGMARSGWKFTPESRNAQINQVGVTLRRGEGHTFERVHEHLWRLATD